MEKLRNSNKKICIIGAGVNGLSVAYRLIELNDSINPLNITITAKDFGRNTTSDGAAGLYRPDQRFMPGVSKELANFWCTESFKFYDRLLFSSEGGKAGIYQASGYQLHNDEREDPTYKDIIYNFRHLTEDELNLFPDKYKYGNFSTTLCVEPHIYMKYLTDVLLQKQVKFIQKEIPNLADFVEENKFDIIFICVGIGADKLCNDDKVKPIRGQMIRVKAPWVKHFYYTDDNCYIIPNNDTCCLGGTRQVNDYRKEIDPVDSKGILDRCCRLCPSLKNASIEWEWAGLRPSRGPTRVERENFKRQDNSSVILVHNYGHGGNGISLSRGTSVHAVNLLVDAINEETKSKL